LQNLTRNPVRIDDMPTPRAQPFRQRRFPARDAAGEADFVVCRHKFSVVAAVYDRRWLISSFGWPGPLVARARAARRKRFIGIFSSLIPKLHLGMRLSAQFYCSVPLN
jgi:hypothetical protein